MVDVTFIFVVLLGGALVGVATAKVRRHDGRRKVFDILGGTIGGIAGTPLWVAFVQDVLPGIAGPVTEMPPGAGALLSNIFYFSPVLGGFLGVGIVALVFRLALPDSARADPWIVKAAQMIEIAGIVYLTMAVCLTLALVVVAAAQARWDLVSPQALALDLAIGIAIIVAGRSLVHAARRIGA
jgi:hypothetical protein